MAHYVISYDLHKARNYQPVWNALASWGAVRLLESLWVVTLADSVGTVREALKALVDADDSIAVIELKAGSDWATFNARQAGVDWLTSNIRRY